MGVDQDPIGLWYTGLTMISDPTLSQQGLNRMRSALTNGIERFIAIDPTTKTMLMQLPMG